MGCLLCRKSQRVNPSGFGKTAKNAHPEDDHSVSGIPVTDCNIPIWKRVKLSPASDNNSWSKLVVNLFIELKFINTSGNVQCFTNVIYKKCVATFEYKGKVKKPAVKKSRRQKKIGILKRKKDRLRNQRKIAAVDERVGVDILWNKKKEKKNRHAYLYLKEISSDLRIQTKEIALRSLLFEKRDRSQISFV
ncbi:hypothetical protein HELRODRAFT_184086 [Helobdella robusta]|uniref:Uncharacterized protein n=1 Tax=Helobdella robusta TaxID=6412 RepID=T1FKJ9_HELRO|nr:hypothetical protein HELRODRAFT_184086 [Helobdella robusta]ESO08280.1 hypothetical protein HELRODRAFT_184086 [Helobdella robusta]